MGMTILMIMSWCFIGWWMGVIAFARAHFHDGWLQAVNDESESTAPSVHWCSFSISSAELQHCAITHDLKFLAVSTQHCLFWFQILAEVQQTVVIHQRPAFFSGWLGTKIWPKSNQIDSTVVDCDSYEYLHFFCPCTSYSFPCSARQLTSSVVSKLLMDSPQPYPLFYIVHRSLENTT